MWYWHGLRHWLNWPFVPPNRKLIVKLHWHQPVHHLKFSNYFPDVTEWLTWKIAQPLTASGNIRPDIRPVGLQKTYLSQINLFRLNASFKDWTLGLCNLSPNSGLMTKFSLHNPRRQWCSNSDRHDAAWVNHPPGTFTSNIMDFRANFKCHWFVVSFGNHYGRTDKPIGTEGFLQHSYGSLMTNRPNCTYGINFCFIVRSSFFPNFCGMQAL